MIRRRTVLAGFGCSTMVVSTLSGCGLLLPQLSDAERAIGRAPKVDYANLREGPGGGLASRLKGEIWTEASAEELPAVTEEAWGRGVKVLAKVYGERGISLGKVVGVAADGREFLVDNILDDPPLHIGVSSFYEHYGIKP